MTIDTKDMLNSILSSIARIDYVKPEDIPNIDLYMDQVTTFMAAAIVLVVIIFCAWFFNRRIQKHDALIAKPLCLTADQEKQVSVRHHHKPRKIVFAIPAAFATNETIHAWAEQVAPRLGKDSSHFEVKTTPQRFFRISKHVVTFTKLENIR